ncbi:MAG: hypothetical protein R2729_14390 [Bryobacteraceae bacterium]
MYHFASARESLAVAAIIAGAYYQTINYYFLSDDFVLLQQARNFDWSLRTTAKPGGDGFFRPVGNLSLAATYIVAGADARLWHAVGLALHTVNSILVLACGIGMGIPSRAALVAALVFALHGAKPEAAVWIAGRFDLLATMFVLAGLLLFQRGRHAAAWIAMILGMLSKESAYAFPLLLPLATRCRTRRVWPFLTGAAALFALRCWILGGIGGYQDAAAGHAQALRFGWPTLKAFFLRLWMALYFPINWSFEPGRVLAVLGVLYIAFLLALTALGCRTRPETAAFVAIAAIPPLSVLGIGSDLANARVLYLPSVGFALMLASALDRAPPPWFRIGALVVLSFHASALRHNLRPWKDASEYARHGCAAALPGPPGHRLGVPLFVNGHGECLDLQR